MAKKERKEPEVEFETPLPPDGGWGWMVMIASFLSNVLVDGILYTFGVLFIDLTHSFPEASKAQISSVGSLLGGFYLIVGVCHCNHKLFTCIFQTLKSANLLKPREVFIAFEKK